MLRRLCVVSVLLLALVAPGCGDDDSDSGADAGNPDFVPTTQCLPTIRISTEGEVPVVSKEEYVAGRVRIDGMGAADPCALADSVLQIKGRGNSTWRLPKKPYALKLEEKAELCGMPAAKSWVLLADHGDRTLLRNALALAIARRMGLAYTPRSQHVELFLNGRYEGVYLLTEKIQVGRSRVDIDVDEGGFLLEADDRSEGSFRTEHAVFLVEEPEEATEEQLQAIQRWVQEAETALFSDELVTDPQAGYATYLDVPSFVRWGLVNELFKNADSRFHSSCWMYRPAAGKLYMGPVWDFDRGAGNDARYFLQQPTGWWTFDGPWLRRMREADPAFRQALVDTWSELGADLEALPDLVQSKADALSCAQENNFGRWPVRPRGPEARWSYQGEVDELRDWLERRIAWMDRQLR